MTSRSSQVTGSETDGSGRVKGQTFRPVHACATLDGIAYTFGSPHGGVMTLTYRDGERVDTRRDQLAFGVTTTQREAVILHVVSANSNDYISVELVRDSPLCRTN